MRYNAIFFILWILLREGGLGLKCPDTTWVANSAGTRCFKNFFFSEEMNEGKASWIDGMHMCSTHGAPLATIHNANEDALVKALTSSADSDCWIGLRKYKKLKPEKGWLWIDRETALSDSDYLNWGPVWQSLWKILPPDEKCGTYQVESASGWGNRPCFLPGSKLTCFVCGTIDPFASDGARMAYANNFNTEGWWTPPDAEYEDGFNDWSQLEQDSNTNSVTEDWLDGASDEDVGIGASGDGAGGVDIPWNPIDPDLIPPPVTTTTTESTTSTTTTTTTPATTTSTTIATTTTSTTSTTPTTTTSSTSTSTTTTTTSTSSTSTIATDPPLIQKTRVRTVTPRQEITVVEALPPASTESDVVVEGLKPSDAEIDDETTSSNRTWVISVAVGGAFLLALMATTAGVVVFRHHQNRLATQAPPSEDSGTEQATVSETQSSDS